MQSLLLQKPHAKTNKHVAYLERGMALWKEGKIHKIKAERKCIQKHFFVNDKAEAELEKKVRGFNHLMLQKKEKQVAHLISRASGSSLLDIDSLIIVERIKMVRHN